HGTPAPAATVRERMSASVSPSPGSGRRKASDMVSFLRLGRPGSVRERAVDGVEDAIEVGQVVLFELRRRIRGVESADPEDRGLEVEEAALRDARGELGA